MKKSLVEAIRLRTSIYVVQQEIPYSIYQLTRIIEQLLWFFLGIVKGKSDGTFGVSELISRQDMAVMAYRAAELANVTLVGETGPAFSDQADIADYAVKAVQDLQSAGILNGMSGNTFVPNGTSTRAQAAKVIYLIMSMLE